MVLNRIQVSVIIPVYNAQQFLRQCLDSVLGQSLREIEVICVDDASGDESPEILREYAERDNRVRVLCNEKNLHAGPCRNRGLEEAQGEYVLFLDADDCVVDGALECLYHTARRHTADVVRSRAADWDNVTGALSYSQFNDLKHVPFFLFHRPLTFRQIYWLLPKVCVAPWGGIVRREFLLEQGIRFCDLMCVNDRSFFWETALRANRIVFSAQRLLHYRVSINTSLVGGRIRNFSCHFDSYQIVEQLTAALPRRMRRAVLEAEWWDMLYWYRKSWNTEYETSVKQGLRRLLLAIDRSPWNGLIERTRWYRAFDL